MILKNKNHLQKYSNIGMVKQESLYILKEKISISIFGMIILINI